MLNLYPAGDDDRRGGETLLQAVRRPEGSGRRRFNLRGRKGTFGVRNVRGHNSERDKCNDGGARQVSSTSAT
jgi:hypothetical protein